MKSIKLVKLSTLLVSLFFSSLAIAGHSSSTGGTIHNIKIHKTSGTPVLMFSTKPYVSPPTCSGNSALEWAVTLDDFGKSVYSLILAAQAQDNREVIHGKHTCEDWEDRESIVHITIAK